MFLNNQEHHPQKWLQNLRYKNLILPSTQMILISLFLDPLLPRLLQSSSHSSNLQLFHSLSSKFNLKLSRSLIPLSTRISFNTETKKLFHTLLELLLTTLSMEMVQNSPLTTLLKSLLLVPSIIKTNQLHPLTTQFLSQLETQ